MISRRIRLLFSFTGLKMIKATGATPDPRTSRRTLLRAGALASVPLLSPNLAGTIAGDTSSPTALSFFVVSDTHYHANRDQPSLLLEENRQLNARLIETLNRLPGTHLPSQLGGQRVGAPRGVIHLGDMIDSGDKSGRLFEQMTDTEWQGYVADFGLTGNDGQLRYPVYEVHGNHDSPRQRNRPILQLIERNKRRPGLVHVSDNGLHYSWDWGDVHFVALGIVVGPNDQGLPISRYDSFDSLPFLVEDLQQSVGTSGRPVVLLHHIDLLRYTRPCDMSLRGDSREVCCEGMAKVAWCSAGCEGKIEIAKEEWSACDVEAYFQAIRDYNIAAIFHGHLHARRTDRWHGAQAKAEKDIAVFGSNNSGAGGTSRSLFYCVLDQEQLSIFEYHCNGAEGWDPTHSELLWRPESWTVPLYR